MPNIREVSERLRMLYDKAIKVRLHDAKEALIPANTEKGQRNVKTISLGREEIVYTEPSPDYCHSNLLTGHRGTLLRYCDPDNRKICKRLCEDCGYRTVMRVVYERNCDKCRTQFTWCCNVWCGKCNVVKAQCMLRLSS